MRVSCHGGRIVTRVNVFPVLSVGSVALDVIAGADPFLDVINNLLINHRFEFSGEVERLVLCDVDFGPVVFAEIVRRAAAPIDDVLVLTLAALFAFPVGDMQIVIDDCITKVTVL